MKRLFAITSVLIVLLSSCQKEIDWGTGANTFGDLLIRAVQVTPATNDTNTTTLQWDASRRLINYKSVGEVNNNPVDLSYSITREADGKIKKIIGRTVAGGFTDSVEYFPKYQSGSSRLAYVIDSHYTFIGTIMDSIVYTYNGGGRVIAKETFVDLFGFLTPVAKQGYTYDGNGNLTVINDSIPDGAGGYDLASTITNTYDSHRSMAILGEESFIILDPSNISNNNLTKQVVTSAMGGGSSTTTSTQFQFNAADKPIKFNMSITPQPPGYDTKMTLYYQ